MQLTLERLGESLSDCAELIEAAEGDDRRSVVRVLLEVETSERRYEMEAREIGNSYLVPLVQRWRAEWALCRQWAGFDESLAQGDREIERLTRILVDLGYELRRSGQDELAAKLDRKLKHR